MLTPDEIEQLRAAARARSQDADTCAASLGSYTNRLQRQRFAPHPEGNVIYLLPPSLQAELN